ncbi:hypothetical protein B0H13DRAFT_2348213 [Mycena leptocephala]|nr:hypothetical protein B0H13DRAFT_2348213 [Mycena leptocephala]
MKATKAGAGSTHQARAPTPLRWTLAIIGTGAIRNRSSFTVANDAVGKDTLPLFATETSTAESVSIFMSHIRLPRLPPPPPPFRLCRNDDSLSPLRIHTYLLDIGTSSFPSCIGDRYPPPGHLVPSPCTMAPLQIGSKAIRLEGVLGYRARSWTARLALCTLSTESEDDSCWLRGPAYLRQVFAESLLHSLAHRAAPLSSVLAHPI